MSATPAFSRRSFLLGSATGLAVGLPVAALAARYGPDWFGLWNTRGAARFTGAPALPQPGLPPMPGKYPGRVIEVRRHDAVSDDHVINTSAVSAMMDRGMAELTGTEPGDVKAAWGTFFQKGDIVGIKVNPVGRKAKPGEPGRVANAVGSISSPELVIKVVQSLKEIGIRPQDIIVFERYANEFIDAGYADLMTTRPLDGVRWLASAAGYSNDQVDVRGFDGGRDAWSPELARHVAGYDPDVFTTMGFCADDHSKNDDRRFRSHLSVIPSRLVDKLVTLPVLKDHRSGGVTLSLKNMSHGMNNNVARSHLGGKAHGGISTDSVHSSGPNQCNTFIPQAASHYRLRQKATLHILDGLIGVYEGGPGCWNRTWGTWRHKGLFFATDPVALDHVGWDIIDAKRVQLGWPPVGRMGRVYNTPSLAVQTALANLAAASPLEALTLGISATNIHEGRGSEGFNLRQPEHVVLAGELGLGVFDARSICYRLVHV
jgi:hypothetical protein